MLIVNHVGRYKDNEIGKYRTLYGLTDSKLKICLSQVNQKMQKWNKFIVWF